MHAYRGFSFASGIVMLIVYTVGGSTDATLCSLTNDNGKPPVVSIDCRKRNLTSLPKQLFNVSVLDLDLSLNTFTILKPSAFHGLENLKKLNISMCGIAHIAQSAFYGLHQLKELDLKNNPVIRTGLPHNMLNDATNLRSLIIGGEVLSLDDVSVLGELKHLEEIMITPGVSDNMSHGIDNLYISHGIENLLSVRKIYFTYCNIGPVLTPAMIQPLKMAHIEELAFLVCSIRHIANNTFDGFTHLRVLNLFGNEKMAMDDVIDALSTSADIAVSTLILDLVGARSHFMIFGQHDIPKCRLAWTYVKNLSVRGTHIIAVNENFRHCLPKLKAISIGFNTIYRCGMNAASCASLALEVLSHTEYIDTSCSKISDRRALEGYLGYHRHSNWIMRNELFFPPKLELSHNCSIHNAHTFHLQPKTTTCKLLTLPPCLVYIRDDHAVRNIFGHNYDGCFRLTANNLQYINISSRYSTPGELLSFTTTVFGLSHLQVVDATGYGVAALGWNFFHDSSLLRILKLGHNFLGTKTLLPFPSFPILVDVDLSANQIISFPPEMFTKLVALLHLNLANNELEILNFTLPSALLDLDLSGNQIISLDSSATSRLASIPQIMLHVDNNPLQCDCSEMTFVQWFQSTTVQINNRQQITCHRGLDMYHINSIDTARQQLKCDQTMKIVEICSISCSLGLLVTATVVLLFRYRFVINWRCYKWRSMRQGNGVDYTPLEDPSQDAIHSAYVVLPIEDASTTNWVKETNKPADVP